MAQEAERFRKQIIDEILTIRCPRCGMAFVDYNGCLALTCSKQTCEVSDARECMGMYGDVWGCIFMYCLTVNFLLTLRRPSVDGASRRPAKIKPFTTLTFQDARQSELFSV